MQFSRFAVLDRRTDLVQDLEILVGLPYPADQDKGGGIGLLQKIFKFVAAVIGVDRDQNRSHPGTSVLGVHPLGQIIGPDGDLVALLDAKGHQSFGDGVEFFPQLSEILPDIQGMVLQANVVSEVFRQNIYKVTDGRFTHFNIRFLHLNPLLLKVKR